MTSDAGLLAVRERTRVAKLVGEEIARVLSQLDMSPDAYEYASSQRGPQRVPFLCTLWCPDPEKKDVLNRGIALHCLGVELMDDLLDGDTGLAVSDLGIGAYLIQLGTSLLCTAGRPSAVHATLERHYRNIWRYQIRELRDRPSTYKDWLDVARVKSGQVLVCYTEIVCFASGIEPDPKVQGDYADALGTLIMVRDDLKDYQETGELTGNLVWLLRERRTDVEAVSALIEELREQGQSALRRSKLDAGFDWFGAFADDAHERLRVIGADKT
jgi:hypothetical protein